MNSGIAPLLLSVRDDYIDKVKAGCARRIAHVSHLCARFENGPNGLLRRNE
jgi:hypothetical protein